jgi:hypothetical protein
MSASQYNQAYNTSNQYKSENPSSTSYNQYNSSSSAYHPYGTNPQASAYAMNQTRYNEASSLQQQQMENEKQEENQRYNANMSYMNTANNNGWEPYGGCCGSSGYSGGAVAGAAAVGMVGGMAMGAAAESAAVPQQPTTIIENVGAPAAMPIGTTMTSMPPNISPTQINGQYYYYYNSTYFKPVFNGSQVVYVASAI